ncbi:MAG: EAL domain-containing protein [Candidatus Thiodiazotropha endolucinida]|nr:EAL domain-containing protein [Candidatus Thiodiazotropha taylori]MCG8091916.1 EAL domain-containing protein [Candidatus Thiodiazotropha taylori]MCW4277296.1 EAL domain-containing protein [Candidatus Thiodiazotropha taylori]MCW4319587.1 EAL domain-containing protein [Candidatus Thiodiazotropha taylori]
MARSTTFSQFREFIGSNHGKIFLFGILISVVLALLAISDKRKDLYLQLEKELAEINILVKRRAHDRLLQLETQFKAVQQLIQQRGENEQDFLDLIELSLNQDPAVTVFQFSGPNGKLLRVSDNLREKSLYSKELNKGNTRAFEMSLKSDRIVIGEAHYLEHLQKWIIPFFFALRNQDNNVSMVITTGIELDGLHNPWLLKGAKDDVGITVTRFYNNDYLYPIYHEPTTVGATRSDLYQKHLPTDLARQIIFAVESAAGKKLEQIQATGERVTWINDLIYLIPAFAVLSYDPDYSYYLGIRRPISSITFALNLYSTYAVAVIIVFNLLTFWVIKHDYQAVLSHEKDLHTKARQDYLTRLPNRFALEEDWEPIQKTNKEISVFYIDLDNFRFVNSHFGHDIGDIVLKKVSNKLLVLLEQDSKFYRLGGDEFLFFSSITKHSELEYIAERILHRINELLLINSIKISMTASIGIVVSDNQSSLGQLIIKADHAMYEAKKVRNYYAFYTEVQEEVRFRDQEIENQLAIADLEKEIYVQYQPQVFASDHTVLGVEVLVRWDNQKLGHVSPAEFIPFAERSGKIIEIGEIIIDKAFRELSRLDEKCQLEHISLNISVHQLMYGGIKSLLNSKSKLYGISPKRIRLEITESLFIEDFQYISNLLQVIRMDGYEVSLDDFGTGYSSLSLIRLLSIDEIKIDKSFIKDLENKRSSAALIKSIISIGKSLGIPVLAEGVEKIEEVNLLTEFGCERFQGYYFAKPMSAEKLDTYLTTLHE